MQRDDTNEEHPIGQPSTTVPTFVLVMEDKDDSEGGRNTSHLLSATRRPI